MGETQADKELSSKNLVTRRVRQLLRKIDETNGMIRNAIPLEIVDRAINAFRKRLRMCIKANGGHIEHFL